MASTKLIHLDTMTGSGSWEFGVVRSPAVSQLRALRKAQLGETDEARGPARQRVVRGPAGGRKSHGDPMVTGMPHDDVCIPWPEGCLGVQPPNSLGQVSKSSRLHVSILFIRAGRARHPNAIFERQHATIHTRV